LGERNGFLGFGGAAIRVRGGSTGIGGGWSGVGGVNRKDEDKIECGGTTGSEDEDKIENWGGGRSLRNCGDENEGLDGS
jgi:hypothetical protein